MAILTRRRILTTQKLESFTNTYNVTSFGAVGNGVADDTAEIQAAIDAAEAAGGGVVAVPIGTYRIASTLVIDASKVRLQGTAATSRQQAQTTYSGSRFLWVGAAGGTMVQLTAVSGLTETSLWGCGLSHLTLDGNETAGICLQLLSVTLSRFENLHLRSVTIAAIDCGVVAQSLNGTSTMQNRFDRIVIDCLWPESNTAVGIRLDGNTSATPAGNTCYNVFTDVQTFRASGPGLKILNGDTNQFFGLYVYSGTGYGVILSAGDASHGWARQNTFYGGEAGNGGLQAAANGAYSSTHNVWYGYSLENSTPLPVVSPGAGLSVYLTDGRVYYNGILASGPLSIVMIEKDDFGSRSSGTATIGELGWTLVTATWELQGGALGHPGIGRLSVAAGAYGLIHIRAGANSGTLNPADFFDALFIVKMTQTDANCVFRIGLGNVASDNPPAEGIYIEKLGGDTQWFGVCRKAAVQTRTAALATVDTNWLRVRIRRIDASTIGFTLDNGTELTVGTNVSTTPLQPLVAIGATGTTKTLDIDYFSLGVSELAR